jgi:hypothetical protein
MKTSKKAVGGSTPPLYNPYTSLGLYCNGLGEGGERALAETLRLNATLASIDLCCEFVGCEGVRKVR